MKIFNHSYIEWNLSHLNLVLYIDYTNIFNTWFYFISPLASYDDYEGSTF